MEVVVNTHGKGLPATKVFFADEAGFEVASVIVFGENEAALLDAQWTLSSAHRVIAEILETGKRLTKIFVTHSHPDHYFGLGHIAEAFPEAQVLALPEDCEIINEQFFGKVEHWEQVIGAVNMPRKKAEIEPLKENYFELEGHRIEIIPKLIGDMKYNSAVWIPSIGTLYGSDLLFNGAHPFTCELTSEERQQWIKDLDFLKTLEPKVVIPGHQKPGMPFDYSSIEFTRKYIELTEEALAKTDTVEGFFYTMFKHFPDAHLVNLSNEMNANVFKGGREWNWRKF
jgi:glyoxylase-like metal-dependent hydrolase (beta-lactamase superfamily II)